MAVGYGLKIIIVIVRVS